MEVTAPSAYTVVAAGTLDSRTVSASTTTWVYEHPAPVSTCLATVQIGLYDLAELTGAAVSPVPQRAASPPPSSRPAPGPSWRISRRTCWSRTRACRGCSTTG
ncbi:hypothetical protein [Streptomyces sp. PRh5]|uniref:hypothetical protein n=1 Tax=Streptomyces sp. PRh5 TaxID=1158056 RepID=UPI001F5268A9|nr:hypothetical protein [Streptomyces sp. PRh5]